jgi:hypothetical protein
MDLLDGDADVPEASQHLRRFLDDSYEHKRIHSVLGHLTAIGMSSTSGRNTMSPKPSRSACTASIMRRCPLCWDAGATPLRRCGPAFCPARGIEVPRMHPTPLMPDLARRPADEHVPIIAAHPPCQGRAEGVVQSGGD